MIVKDMMPAFELYQPTQLADALALLDRHRADGWKLAGGNDSLSWFKERAKRPKAVIDAIMPAMGRVSTKKDGRRWANTLRTANSPTPFDTRSSTRRRSSFVSMTKQRVPRLRLNGESSSPNI